MFSEWSRRGIEQTGIVDEQLPYRSFHRPARSRLIAAVALKALLRVNELLGRAIGTRLPELRDSDDR
jgi:hypothetical protein